jgi:hypothetical protein
VDHNSEPGFHLLLRTLRESFLSFWLHLTFPGRQTCCCFCLLVSSWDTNFAEIHCVFKSSIRICWYVPYERPNLPAISEMVLHWSSLTILQTFSTFSPVRPMERLPEYSVFSWSFPMFEWRKKTTQRSVFSPWHCKRRLFWAISYAVFLSLKLYLMQMNCSFISAICKSQIILNTYNSKHPLRSSTKGYGGKTCYTDSEDSHTMAHGGRKLYYLLFSVLAVSPGAFGYTFISLTVASCSFPERLCFAASTLQLTG